MSSISETLKAKIRASAGNRCGYCRSLQIYVLGLLEIEHIIPKAKGGTDDEENLWLACRLCNNYKGTQTDAVDPVTNKKVKLFNPRKQKWSENFEWSSDGAQIIGTTATGRATVIALQLNNIISVTVRQQWVLAGWHPPTET
ncbi:HNH endonuclease [Dulcicalothrix desertica PCC 7102]|uniref:HNH endonuclease n=1 Tax=Dulcicalothrix desertica PCC 7102 TaxID=232991 RepID=A0A433VSC7_9CYAN|nr:HNH endonuclease signature motif containing protein [Dulcicalothrix desertica]RUT08902.1 HNH endonuclease [Dulcicalothrix desertica PCC 7102]TWH49788.1 Restriction endonuclease [Dulcicalothrix desertica PCC 7102]